MMHIWIENRHLLIQIGRDGAVLKSARGKEVASVVPSCRLCQCGFFT
jgi:hypothetical protein